MAETGTKTGKGITVRFRPVDSEVVRVLVRFEFWIIASGNRCLLKFLASAMRIFAQLDSRTAG